MKLLTPLQRLPDRPSWLIRAALLDIAECECDPRYALMSTRGGRQRPSTSAWLRGTTLPESIEDEFWNQAWHGGDEYGVCHICFAGAVMAKSCLAPFGEYLTPDDFDLDTRKKLMALNEFRQGDIYTALVHILDYPNCPLEVERKITPYAENRMSFKYEMRQLANELEARGL